MPIVKIIKVDQFVTCLTVLPWNTKGKIVRNLPLCNAITKRYQRYILSHHECPGVNGTRADLVAAMTKEIVEHCRRVLANGAIRQQAADVIGWE